MTPDIVHVPLSTQLLAFAILMQIFAFAAVLWRGILGLPQLSTRRPRWPFLPLILGTGAGLWFAWLKQDLVFGAAQGLALFIGFCLINSTRGQQQQPAQPAGTRRERREAEREARRAAKRGDSAGE